MRVLVGLLGLLATAGAASVKNDSALRTGCYSDSELVAELIQGDMTGERIAAEALRLLGDEGVRRKMKADLDDVRQRLSSERDPMDVAAECIEQVLVENGIKQ